jgi:hypothetical protein
VKGLEVAKGLKELISTLRLVVLAANVSSVCLAIISQRPAGLGGRIIGSTATHETFPIKGRPTTARDSSRKHGAFDGEKFGIA